MSRIGIPEHQFSILNQKDILKKIITAHPSECWNTQQNLTEACLLCATAIASYGKKQEATIL
jgi:hypothetical protein